MFLKKGQLPILLTIVFLVLFFSLLSLERENYEFLMYIGVIILLIIVFVFTSKKLDLSNGVLWGMVLWAFMHMSGGLVFIKGQKLYTIVLFEIFKIGEETFFRYDHLVHIIGFGVATWLLYELLKNSLNKKPGFISLSLVLVFAGMGVGALNELIEFFAVVILPETGVGGYENTLLDMVSNTIGAIIAVIIINLKKGLLIRKD